MIRFGAARRHDELRRREQQLHGFLEAYAGAADKGPLHVLQRPGASTVAFANALRLPRVRIPVPEDAEGQSVHRDLSRGITPFSTPLHRVFAAIAVPRESGVFMMGSSMKTLRRQKRSAERLGVVWEPVTDRGQRRLLIHAGDAHERTGARDGYRTDGADNREIVDFALWLLARAADGRPLIIAVAPVDGDVATLRYFRTLEESAEASAARYLMTAVLVEELRRRGVRHLVDTAPSMHLQPGLRHFQRMVGFRLVRVHLDRFRTARGRRSLADPPSSQRVRTHIALPAGAVGEPIAGEIGEPKHLQGF